MPWLKAAASGMTGSLLMLLVLQMVLGGWIPAVQAPFNVAPSAAFLHLLGLNVPILALLLHFGYGAAGSAVLLWLFWDRTGVRNGVGLAVVLWLGMMLVLSPMLGWGFFGWPGTPDRPAGDPLYLQGGMLYPLLTLFAHLLYGIVIGTLNRRWVRFGEGVAAEIRRAAREDEI